MTKKSALMLLIVLITAVVAAVLVYFVLKEQIPTIPEFFGTGLFSEEAIAPPKATGNINDLTEALLKELDDEDLVLQKEDSEINLINSDAQEINDFGQSIDEGEIR